MATATSHRLVKKEYTVPFILITVLFFLWGFARSILDVLNKHFQQSMDMSRTESAWIQVAMYAAYFLVAIPAGLYINRQGYRRGVVFGLVLFAAGALMFIPSEMAMSFLAFLLSLFVIGSGLVFLEVAANPYVTELGDPSTAASRLNLSQSFNGAGCICGPFIGGLLLFQSGGTQGNLSLLYGLMGVIVLAVALIFCRVKLPEITAQADEAEKLDQPTTLSTPWASATFTFGIVALLCYEIAEISINSFFINYVTDDGWLDAATAAKVLSLGGLMLFMVGRVLGSAIMSRVRAEKVLLICGILTVCCCALIVAGLGTVSRIALLACYLFESIMFPTVFAISLRGLGGLTKRAASFLMMTPIGGAVGTMLMGVTADALGMSLAFIVPMVGYAVVLAFAAFQMKK